MANEFIVKNGLISQNNIIVSGSITVTGGVTISGSIASASYAANAELLDGLDSTAFTLTSSFNTQTASFTAFTSSINSFSASVNTFSASILTYTSSLNAKTASFATTGSNTFIGTETISGSLAISGSGTPFTLNTDTLEITGSLIVSGSNTVIGTNTVTGSMLISGSLTATGTITAQTLVVQTVTSSTVYSSGSNIFGNTLANTQTFTGSVLVTGSLTISTGGNASAPTIFGSTISCSPIGCFATSCATSFIGGTMSGTTIYGSTAVCSPSIIACTTSAAAITIDGYSKLSFKDRGTEYGTINASRYNFGGELAIMSFQSGNCFLFLNGTNCLMFIGSNGNVGISTTNPQHKLDIQNGNLGIYYNTNVGGCASGAQIYLGDSNFQGGAYACSAPGIGAVYAPSTLVAGDLAFFTYTGIVACRTERMRIVGGNVGIGTTIPYAKLHVAGTIYSNVRCNTIDTDDGISNNFQGYGGYWALRTDESNRFNLDVYNSGTPITALQLSLAGAACFSGQVCATSGIKFGSGASTLNYYEQGTWTPRLKNGSFTTNAGATQNAGWYTRIGNLVTVGGTLEWGAGSGAQDGNSLQITCLPFASSNVSNERNVGQFGAPSPGSIGFKCTQKGQIVLVNDPGASYIYLIETYQDGSYITYRHDPLVANAGVIYGFQITYHTL